MDRPIQDSEGRSGEGCAEALRLLDPAIDREIAPAERELLDRHLAACGACRARLAGLEAAWALLARAPAPELSGGSEFLRAVRGRIRRRSLLRRAWLAAAAAAVAVCAGLPWLLRAGDDRTIIENLAVLEDLGGGPAGAAEVTALGRELLSFLRDAEDGERGEGEVWLDLLESALDEEEKRG